MKIGFIGLGAMGFPMARHLSKQHELIVWNRTREKAERQSREYGSHLARDLADTAQAEVIITMLPTSREVDEIVDRLLPSVRRGTLWIDATSGDPNVSRETAKRLAEKGVEFVDAPVTGATVGAENATLTIMVGGSAEDFARAEPILRIVASIAHQQHASTPMLALTQNLFTAALHQLGDQADYIEVAKIIANMNGTTWEAR